jgi:hypothetical protein
MKVENAIKKIELEKKIKDFNREELTEYIFNSKMSKEQKKKVLEHYSLDLDWTYIITNEYDIPEDFKDYMIYIENTRIIGREEIEKEYYQYVIKALNSLSN